jgi:iron(III) transport system ATP-binding protein
VRPQCLLLDEPLSNLDAKLRVEMRSEIRRICKEAGLTAVYVTHDQKEALSVADRLAVMDRGGICQVGTPREIYVRPGTVFVANFIGETNLLPGRVQRVRGDRVRILTGIGVLESLLAGGPEVGASDTVTVSLRPEAVRLGDPPRRCPNVVKGRVRHSVYLGEVAQHDLTVASAAPALPGPDGGASTGETGMKAFELRPSIRTRDPETEVRVWFEPDDVVVLTE